MIVIYENLTIRNASAKDADQLCAWWNDGKVMAHAGFPNGVGDTPENIREKLSHDSDETGRRHIIELDGRPIGEMSYGREGEQVAGIGIKICDFGEQEKGYGTILLTIFIDALFQYYGYNKIILDTNVNNTRAQHVYEKKLGFKRIRVRENSWQNQLGEWQSSIDCELEKGAWQKSHPNIVPYTFFRAEQPFENNERSLIND